MTPFSSPEAPVSDDFPDDFCRAHREIVTRWRSLRDVAAKIRRDTLIGREPSLPVSLDGIIATADAFDALIAAEADSA